MQGQPRRNGTLLGVPAALPAILGLLAIAFWFGDFVAQWRIHRSLLERIVRVEERFMHHDSKDGHSKVIERLTVLEGDVEYLKEPWAFRPPLGDID